MAVRIQDGSGNSITSTNNAVDVNVKSSGVTLPVSAVSLPLPSNAAQETGGNLATLVANTPAPTAKGTQGTAFQPVQEAKDSGRSKVILSLTKVTAITTEALVTLTQKKGDATTTSATTYTVTAGKTLRIQSIFLGMVDTTTAALWNVAIRLREGAAAGGTVSVTSDIIAELETGNGVATLQSNGQSMLGFNDGLEIAGGQQIGISELASAADGVVTIVLIGYEY